jgi:hypothetical protein
VDKLRGFYGSDSEYFVSFEVVYMSVHKEKVNAITRTRDFLHDLMDRSKTKRVPSDIRKAAYWCLRHYPNSWDIIIRTDFPTKAELKALELLAGTKDEDHPANNTDIAKKKTQTSRTRKPK